VKWLLQKQRKKLAPSHVTAGCFKAFLLKFGYKVFLEHRTSTFDFVTCWTDFFVSISLPLIFAFPLVTA